MKPVVIFDPHWRTVSELFSEPAYAEFSQQFDIVWGRDEPVPSDVLQHAWPDAFAYIAAEPVIDSALLAQAPSLRAVVEVSGAFPETIDYHACAQRGVEVLSCAPGFRNAVAEMGLAMALSAARGLITEHEAFRSGGERWLEDNSLTDFTLYGGHVGFVGFGQIARELTRLLAPFNAQIRAFDPWLSQDQVDQFNVELCSLEELASLSRCLFVTASPTRENQGLVSRQVLAALKDHSLVVVLSRAHLIDFDALADEAVSGRLRVATDVYPEEPLAATHPLRSTPNALLSPHRAAAVDRGRQLIGDMILHDLKAIEAGSGGGRQLATVNPDTIADLAGVGDASQVADMAATRQ
jgi:phosphoglycerate dehydrogenase-like enzyme